MHRHLTDEDLILHYYGEAAAEDEAAIDAHLENCADCQAMWQEIRTTLEMVDAAKVPEPGEDFEQVMWARVQSAIPAADGAPDLIADGAPDLQVRGRRKVLHWLMPAVGLAAAVLIAIAVGRQWRAAPATHEASSNAPAATTARVPLDPKTHERVLLTALNDHFQRSELLLVELMNGGANEELGFERQTADDLLDSSRLYRATAQQNGNVRLADMLEELESVLTEIARSPEQMNRVDMRSLRARIDSDNLLFKVRAVSQQIQERQRSLSTE